MSGVEVHSAHALHGEGREYRETNCYADVLVELLHSRGLEPLAVMGVTVRTDFEGDQFSFFKPTDGDLEELLGVDVHEMQPYRPLHEQLAEQLDRGRTMLVELDSFYLPDTAATSYRTEHVKTTIAAAGIDVAGERLAYFHNTGLHELSGEDFRAVLRVDAGWTGEVLPPYCELVRFDLGEPLRGEALRAAALERTRRHLARRPEDDPFARFGARLAEDLPELLAGDAARYHDYAFATVRMAGSAFEVCAAHVDWLLGAEAGRATAALGEVVQGCKVLSFRLARRRPFDPAPRLAELGAAWSTAMDELGRALG